MDLYKEFKQEKQAIKEFLDAYWNFRVSKKTKIQTRKFEGSPLCEDLTEIFSPIPETVILAHGRSRDPIDVVIESVLVQGINRGIVLGYEDMKDQLIYLNGNAKDINAAGVLEEKLILLQGRKAPNCEGFEKYFEKDSDALRIFLKSYFSISAQPKGYRAYKKSESTLERNLSEHAEFKGVNTHESLVAGHPPFIETLSEPNVFYGDTEQGRTPFDTLICAVLRQGMTLGKNYVENSHEGYAELKKKIDNVRKDPKICAKIWPPLTEEDKKILRSRIAKDLNKLMKKDSRGK
ncbi:hypothetical protein HZA97_07730 [Candidatus Woesearchaeota archaeon]|nr:hypothetical protein [Candidatus Woesearchaeota archaeon]